MSKSILIGLSVGLSLAVTGCGADAGSGQAPGLTGSTLSADGSDLAGVEVCVESSPDLCTTSDAHGVWTLPHVPAQKQLWLSFEKAGFVAALRPVVLGAAGNSVRGLEETQLSPISGETTFDGSLADPTRGQIAFQAAEPSATATDVSVALFGVDGKQRQPTYLAQGGRPIPGAATGTHGGFVDLPAGDYLMTFQGPSAACGNEADPGYLAGFAVVARTGDPMAMIVVVKVISGHLTGPVMGGCEALGSTEN